MPSLHPLRLASLLVELLLCLAALALFLTASPSSREMVWSYGGRRGWNSDPAERIYFYANYRSPPPIPLIWSAQLTASNRGVAGLGLVLWAARIALFRLRFEGCLVDVVYDFLLAGLWWLSAEGQSSADDTDGEHLSDRPWYLTRGCAAVEKDVKSACRLAQAGYGIAIVLVLFYVTRLLGWFVLWVSLAGRSKRGVGKRWDDGQSVGDREGVLLDLPRCDCCENRIISHPWGEEYSSGDA